MDLAHHHIDISTLKEVFDIKIDSYDDIVIALAGNPNTGKSTIFNSLTGLNQHTGNWPGKTVFNAQGKYIHGDRQYVLIDLPGTYSLLSNSLEEEIARDFICFGNPHATIVVMDATSLERNLNLALQIMEITDKIIICVNLLDEAKRKNIKIDLKKLEKILGIPVVGTVAKTGEGLEKLKNTVEKIVRNELIPNPNRMNHDMTVEDNNAKKLSDSVAINIIQRAEDISQKVVSSNVERQNFIDYKIDKLLTSKIFGFPVMLGLLGIIFWITISGANIPSDALADMLLSVESFLSKAFKHIGINNWVHDVIILGVFRTLAWVISVMLPPMAIFFPLFTFLEDLGYLPRIAFNLDYYFRKAGAHGKQALSMCMGFGCNAVGVTSCRIIDSPRERLIAIITNNFVPCNGRFPILIAVAAIFIGGQLGMGSVIASLSVLMAVSLGVLTTLFISKILTKTILKGLASSFILELPPYRKPQIIKTIIHSIFDRTLFVLGRAVMVAAPAGLIIWLMANIFVKNVSLLIYCVRFLDPFAQLLGLDGHILMAFVLGFPANEIVIPILIMSYMSKGTMLELSGLTEMKQLFIANNWTWLTAICTMLFTLNHWPCGTTLLTIRKETQSWKWTWISLLIPTIAGIIMCFIVAQCVRLLNII